jgi:ATP-dependent DNA ligase
MGTVFRGWALAGGEQTTKGIAPDVTGQGAKFFALACKRRLEAIVSKRAKAPYRRGRSLNWQNSKCMYS